MSRFTDKVAIVTGSSNGIGRGTALLFAQEGAKVTITGRNEARLEETRQEIIKSGVSEGNVLAIVADITTEDGQNKLINSTIEKFGRLDILVNNAGAAFMDEKGNTGIAEDVSVYDKTMEVNLRSIVLLTQKAVPHLISSKGEVVNVSSIAAGPQAYPSCVYYAMSKAALDQYTKSAALDLIKYGIRVNSVSPGGVITGLGPAMGMTEEQVHKMWDIMKQGIPAGFIADPVDIANVIAFLADRKVSRYIIGQSIVADGGSILVMKDE